MSEQNIPLTDAEIVAKMSAMSPEDAATIRRRALTEVAISMGALDPFSLGSQAHREFGHFVLPTEAACHQLLSEHYLEKYPQLFASGQTEEVPVPKTLREHLQSISHDQYLVQRKENPEQFGLNPRNL